MVALRLGQERDPRDQPECADEVVEGELAGQVAAAVPLPTRDLAEELGDLLLRKGRCPGRVLPAMLVDQLRDG